MPISKSFNVAYNGIARVLSTKILISTAFDPAQTNPHPPAKEYIAIWDTGATGTVVTQRVITELGLQPIGRTKIHHAKGEDTSLVYLINVMLPQKVGFANIRVTEGDLPGDADVLIGMDIINSGDFAITNCAGKTNFTFRVPSIECIDFVKQAKQPTTSEKVGRNSPCSCGSGKKYKKCHGK